MPEKWSCALITDPHIGCYLADYGHPGFDDKPTGQDYFLTERLRRTVRWINASKDDPAYNTRLVVVNGDITHSAEESEFYKAREILDGLEVPYVPVLGNHDVWPYTDEVNSTEPIGSYRFDDVFSGVFAELAAYAVIEDWSKDANTIAGTPLENYAFSIGGVHFVVLDLNSRKAPIFGPGIDGRGVFYPETRQWMIDRLDSWSGEPVVLISHHALTNKLIKPAGVPGIEWELVRPLLAQGMPCDKDCEDIAKCLEGRDGLLLALAGHTHSAELLIGHLPTPPFIWNFNVLGFEPIGGTEVWLTESTAASSNGPEDEDKGTIRRLTFEGDELVDYSTVVGEECPLESPAFNPSFDINGSDHMFAFVPHRFTKLAAEYRFDFGDGTDSGDFTPFEGGWEDRVNLLDTESHEYSDGRASHTVTLTVRRAGGGPNPIEESVSREMVDSG